MSALKHPGEKRRTEGGRWTEILDTAADIFYEKGYDATSIQDVADDLGMLKGSLYHYISSKEDLLFGIVKRFHDRGHAHLQPVLTADGSVLELLNEFVVRHVEHNTQNFKESAVLNHDLRSLTGERRSEIMETRAEYDVFLRSLLERGQEEGTVRPGLDPKLAAIGVLSMLNSVYVWYKPSGERSGADVARAYADLVVQAVAERQPPRRRRASAAIRK